MKKMIGTLMLVALVHVMAPSVAEAQRVRYARPVYAAPVYVVPAPVYVPPPVYVSPRSVYVPSRRVETMHAVSGIVATALGGTADIISASRTPSQTTVVVQQGGVSYAPAPVVAPAAPMAYESPPPGFAETGRRYHSRGSNRGQLDWLRGVLNGREVKVKYNDFGQIRKID